MINRHTNPKYKVETEISQGLLAFPILFMIYISGVFSEKKSWLLEVTCLLFMNDLKIFSS